MKKPLLRMLWCDSVAPFGNARRAGRVLDVDRVIELQHAFPSGELRLGHRGAAPHELGPSIVEHERLDEIGALARAPRRAARRSRLPRNSRASSRSFTPACRNTYPSSDDLYAGLMFTRMAPMRAVANCMMTHSKRFGDQMPTRSPCSTPRGDQRRGARTDVESSRARDTWRDSSATEPRARHGPPCRSAVRRRFSPMVSPRSGVGLVP